MPSRTLNVVVSGDARGLNRTFAQVGTTAKKTEGHILSLGRSGSIARRGLADIGHGAAYALGAGGFGGGLYALFDIGKKINEQYRESQTVSRQTAAALKSTGGAANISAKGVQDLATAISRKSGIDDEAIQSGENMLLTFTKIRNESGKGNKVFNQATQAVTDMATAMNRGATPSAQQLTKTAILVGKALNDPIKGSTALRRVGVDLTKQQIEQIKTLESHGKHLDAQKLILRELTREFGGSAAKQRTAAKSLNVEMGNLAEVIGKHLAPFLTDVARKLTRFIRQMQDGKGAGGQFVQTLKAIGTAVGDAADAVGKAFSAIRDAVGKTSNAIRGFLHRNQDDVRAVEKMFRNLGIAIREVFEHVILPVVKRVMPGVRAVVEGALKVIVGIVRVFSGVLTGNWSKAWKGLKGIVSGALQGVGGTIRAFSAPMREAASRLGQVFSLAFKAALSGIVSFFRGRINELIDLINGAIKAYNAIPIAPNIGPIGHVGSGGGGGGVRNTNVPGVLRETHGAIRPGPVSVRPPRGHTATAGAAAISVMAHASGEAGGQELGSLKRAQAWVKANYPGVGTLLEDAGSANQHLHIEAAKGTVVQIGKALQRAGFSVGENPAFGGVHPVHSHGGLPGIPGDHYTGNAIDVNADNRSLGVPTGKSGGSSTSTTQPKWRECVLTWYDPALGGINTGGGKKDPFHPTASGEAYNPRAYTCAAPHGYAFGTIIVFAYGGRAVACKVNDRGGAITGHHFDLSRAAAASLGIMGAGKTKGLFMLPGKSKSIKKAKTPYDKLQNQLGYIGLEEEAGVITPTQSAQQQIAAINKTLPSLTGSNRLRALGVRRTEQQRLKTLAPPKPIKQRVGTSIDDPWLQTWIQHQQDLMDAGLLDPIVGRDNIANVLDQFAKGKGVSEHDRLAAMAQARDLRFQNLSDITSAAPDVPDSVSDEGVRLAHIDAQLRAGDITDEQARGAKIASLQDALALWNLTDDARLELRGELNDLMKEQTASTEDLTNAIKDLQKSIDEQTNFGKSVAATEAGAMARWVTSVVSRVQGYDISGRGLTPAYGVARRS